MKIEGPNREGSADRTHMISLSITGRFCVSYNSGKDKQNEDNISNLVLASRMVLDKHTLTD